MSLTLFLGWLLGAITFTLGWVVCAMVTARPKRRDADYTLFVHHALKLPPPPAHMDPAGHCEGNIVHASPLVVRPIVFEYRGPLS